MSNVKRIQVIPSQIDRPALQEGVTLTGTYSNLPYNKNAIKRLQAIVGDNFVGDLNIFDNEEESFKILPLEKIQQLLTQVLIRFDNSPDYYTKSDYQYLIWYLCQSLGYFSQGGVSEGDLESLQRAIAELQEKVSILSETKQDLLSAGNGIEIDSNTISAKTTESFKVSNVNIGGYVDGMVISENTPIVDILKTILQKVINLKVTAPSAKLLGDSYQAEYGSETIKSATIALTQGSFISADPDFWMTNQKMDCTIAGISDDWNWTISEDKMSATTSNKYTATSLQTFTVPSIQISENTVVPKKSNGEYSDVVYHETSLPVSGNIKVTPYYKIYFGSTSAIDVNTITVLDIKALKNSIQAVFPLTTTATTKEYKGGGKSIVVACPSVYHLSAVTDSMGNSILSLFRKTKQIDIPCGNDVLVKYNVYLYPISNGADQAYKNLTFNLT